MKSFKFLLIIFFTIAIITPSVALAAWWNPVSWKVWSIFKKNPTPVVQTEIKTEATITPSANTPTTTTEKKVIPQPKATAPKTAITQEVPIAEPVVVFNSEDRIAIKTNALKIIGSRDKLINSLKDRKTAHSNTKYPEEYTTLDAVIDKTISIFESEKVIAKLLVDAADKAPDASRDGVINAYTELLSIVEDTNKDVPYMFSEMDRIHQLSNDIVKARIELEVINELSNQYGVSGTQTSTADRASLTKQADDYIKSLVDAQEKLKESKKEKILLFLKVIITTPAR